jgi:hypothetical protein
LNEKTIYSLLRAVVQRATFMTETEQKEYLEVIDKAEQVEARVDKLEKEVGMDQETGTFKND